MYQYVQVTRPMEPPAADSDGCGASSGSGVVRDGAGDGAGTTATAADVAADEMEEVNVEEVTGGGDGGDGGGHYYYGHGYHRYVTWTAVVR